MYTHNKPCVKDYVSIPCPIGTDVWVLDDSCEFAPNNFVKGKVVGYKILEKNSTILIKEDFSKLNQEFAMDSLHRLIFFSPTELHDYLLKNKP